MALTIILFSLALACASATYCVINFLRLSDYTDSTSFENSNKRYLYTLICKIGLSIFGILCGVILMFYGIILSIIS